MKSIIIYLSVTGNTGLIARTIQKGIKQVTGQCDVVKHKEASWRQFQEYDLIGFGCPPMLQHIESPSFRALIDNIRFVGGKHAFVFATHGTKPDYIFPSMITRLQKRGLLVVGSYDCYAPCYLSQMPWPYPTAGHPDKIDLKAAGDFGREIVERSRRISAGEIHLIPPIPEAPKEDPALKTKMDELMAKRKREGKPSLAIQELMEFHKELCTYPECRLCMDNCPEDAIDLSLNPPSIGKGCIGCTLCAKICPTGAMDESRWLAEIISLGLQANMSAYIESSVKLEKEGRFRRLLSIDKIGIGTPVYSVFNKHPQWIIGKGFNR
jgi:ferredoxin